MSVSVFYDGPWDQLTVESFEDATGVVVDSQEGLLVIDDTRTILAGFKEWHHYTINGDD